MQTVSQDLADQILQAVATGFDEQIKLTQDLIRFPSQRGDEAEVQAFVEQQLIKRGFQTERIEYDHAALAAHPGAGKVSEHHSKAPAAVCGVMNHTAKGRSLLLNGHVDVVPTGPTDLWSNDPYDPIIKDGWLYGRGGADMKCGVGAIFGAVDALRSLGLRAAAPLTICTVTEEESTGNGSLMAHLKGYRADAVIIPEPEEEKLVRANIGVLWFQVRCTGAPVHVREMDTGSNAIDAAYRVVAALRQLEQRWNESKASYGTLFAAERHPINLNIGKIDGGDWASSVPAHCTLDCRISIYPGVVAAEAAKEIENCVSQFAASDSYLSGSPPTVTWNGFFAEGYQLEEGSEAEEALAWAHKLATGSQLESFLTPGYLDTRIHVLYDKVPALCYGPISRNIHGFDEACEVASIKRITGAMALHIAAWCGVEKLP